MQEADFLLAWPTVGNRLSLLPSIDSLASNIALYGHKACFLVACDSPDGISPDVAKGIKELELKHGIKIAQSNPEARRKLLAGLDGGPDRELLEYALFPDVEEPGYGVNVNYSMLAGAGRLLVSIDDDIISKPALSLMAEEEAGDPTGPESSDAGSREYSLAYIDAKNHYFENRKSLLAKVQEVDIDILSAYKKFLGKTLSSFVKDLDPELDSTIMLASPGLYGDSGMGSARGVLSLSGKARQALMEEGYNKLKLAREVLRIPPKITLSKNAKLMASMSAFYNKLPFVPFLPCGRNSDGASGLISRILYPKSATAFMDFGLYHSQPERGFFPIEQLLHFVPGLADMIMALAIAYMPSEEVVDPTERYRELGSTFEKIAGQNTGHFVEIVHNAFSMQYMAVVEHLESLLDEYNRQPADWAEDCDIHIASINEVLREPHALFGKRGCGLSVDRVRHHIAMFGALLAEWPDIWAYFRSNRAVFNLEP